MATLLKISESIWFWRIMFFVMVGITIFFYITRPRVVMRSEYIYLIHENPSDSSPVESKFI